MRGSDDDLDSIGSIQTMQRQQDTSPKGLLAILFLLVILGVAGTTASILSARGTASATKTDVAANRELLNRVAELESVAAREAQQHRIRNEELHGDICRLIYSVVQAAPSLRDAGIEPCAPAIIPSPLPNPVESPR